MALLDPTTVSTVPDGPDQQSGLLRLLPRGLWRLRIALTERHKLFGLTLLIGALCGLAAVAFHLLINLVGTSPSTPRWRPRATRGSPGPC